MNKVIEKFYTAFTQKDWQTMQSCYHDEVIFEDPAFGKLHGDEAKKMWRMLCEQGKDLKIEFSAIEENESDGKAHWEAWYTFSLTGKKVHNVIDAAFEFKDGLIIGHKDSFNLHKWAKQALGFKGWLLGGTNFFKKKFQEQARKSLKKYS
ncbi:MAG: nuclear transport factor 2 family protein [Flavobacteriales bacterium]|nr:nuclear transport factor 2 family protein [Flavobacteriales bacterium]